jgi:hypothetical protein
MTRQERISAIGKLKPSTFNDFNTKEPIAKNQMSYFIIPFAHELYEKRRPKEIEKRLQEMQWKIVNNSQKRAFSQTDPRQMDSIKQYLYDEMIPKYDNIKDHFINLRNLLLQKEGLERNWTFKYFMHNELEYETQMNLDGIDLWIVDRYIAFFTIKTQLCVNDTSTIHEISSKYNRAMRDFKAVYVDEKNAIFSNDSDHGIPLFDWLCGMLEIEGRSLLTNKKEKLQDIQNIKKYYPIFNASYNAKMITAIHVDEMEVEGEAIEDDYTEDLISMYIDGVSTLEEMPYLLATTSELYPSKMWESNEEYIFEKIGDGQINIWKYWSGVALQDSFAFFSIGAGGSAIVNSARNSYYFIYILNLYASYKLRYFENELIDDDFVSIENIRPLLSDAQRLKNQYMCTELSSLFQPNAVHQAVKNAMKVDDMYDEIKGNIEVTLDLTARNTDIIVTVVVTFFSMAGLYFNQEKLLEFFAGHTTTSIVVLVIFALVILWGVSKRSTVMRWAKKIRAKVAFIERMMD